MLQLPNRVSDVQQQNARFAMVRLEFGSPEKIHEPISAPPHTLFQDSESYNILFNMYGIPASKIKLASDSNKNQLTIFAERDERDFTDQFLWLFSLPSDAALDSLETYYKKGVVQFRLPKMSPLLASGI